MKSNLFVKASITFIVLIVMTQLTAQTSSSLQFNGSDNYVEVMDSPLNIIDTGDFTFEAWIKGEESKQSNHPVIFSNRGTSSFGGGIVLFFHNQWGGSASKMLGFQINAANYVVINNGSFNGSLLDNECHHIAITREGNTLSFYADGLLFGTKVSSGSKSIAFDGPLWIGQDRAINETFNGQISQVRIWDLARSETEILENTNISLQGNEIGLLAYWEMDEDSGQMVMDKTTQFHGHLGSETSEDVHDPLWSSEGCVEIVSSASNLEALPLRIYPNPTSNFITIENQKSENLQLELISQTGKLLISKLMNTESFQIDLGGYPSGFYFIKIINKEESITYKVIKN